MIKVSLIVLIAETAIKKNTRQRSFPWWKKNFDSSSDFDNYITVKGRKWRVYIPYKNAKYPPMEFSYILCYDEYLEKDSYDYTSVMLSLNIENIASDINIFREYMKHIDLWDGENFGIHSVAEDDY